MSGIRNEGAFAGLLSRVRAGDERFWLRAAVALSLVPALAHLAFVLGSPYVVQNDARQFVFWMNRWIDPAPFDGDLLADYWASVSPYVFRLVYRALFELGATPLVASKLLPTVLIPLCTWLAYRVGFTLSRHGFVAFCASLLVLAVALHAGCLLSSTPRAFGAPLIVAVVDAFLRRRTVAMAGCLLLLAAFYPQPALALLAGAGISKIRVRPRFGIDLSRESLAQLAACAVAVGIGVAPLFLRSSGYGPVVSLDEARTMPTFQSSGRTETFQPDGSLDFLCGPRVRWLPEFLHCHTWHDLRVPPYLLLVLWPTIATGIRAWRGRASREEIGAFLALPIGATVCWAVAASVLFQLHLPSRYSGRVLELLAPLALGLWLGRGALRLARTGSPPFVRHAVLPAAFLAVLAGAVVWRAPETDTSPEAPAIVDRIAKLPPDAVVASLEPDIDYVPILALRRVLFSYELAVPYHLGYFRQIRARIESTIEAERTRDPAVLAGYFSRFGVTAYLADLDRLAAGHVTEDFASIVGARVEGEPGLLAERAGGCAILRSGRLALLDGHCLATGRMEPSAPTG